MATTLNFKDIVDIPEWRFLAVAPTANVAGRCLTFDLRNQSWKNPYIWHLVTTTYFDKYHKMNDEWVQPATFTAIGGSIAAGSGAVFVPSHGPTGTIGGTPSTTAFTLAALPNSASATINQLANQGDGVGYRIRVIGNGAGGSGKTEEKYIIANTSGTTPVVTLDSALTFTPQTTDKYEILSGRIYCLGAGTTAAGFWKAYDVATGSISGNLSTTNLASTIGTDFAACMLDEQYVPYNRQCGEGFIVDTSVSYNNGNYNCLQATNSAAGTLTGQAASGDAAVLANEYRNFQIRIVEDTAIPTAVGQRRKITSHTAGASPVYTIASNWTVTPSTNCKYVIELNNDLLLFTNAATVTYSYAAGGYASDANWSTAAASGGATQYANPGFAMGAGCIAESAFSLAQTADKNVRNSFIYWFRGAASVSVQYLDIAAGANGVWTTIVPQGMPQTTITTGSCSAHASSGNQGRYFYFNLNGGQRFYRFDMQNMVVEPWCFLRYGQSTAVVGGRLAVATFIDGNVKVGFLYLLRSSATDFLQVMLQR